MIANKMKWFSLCCLVGFMAGLTSTIFLYFLKWATDYRMNHMTIIWFLPLTGLAIGVLYHLYGSEAVRGNNLILEEIHDPKKTISLRMAPMVLFGTIFTHLFGGSAGREGTAVQMSASIADNFGRLFKVDQKQRILLLMAGAGAGFGTAIGTPLAGMIFGMEVISIGKFHWDSWWECLLASLVGYYTTYLLKAPHSHYPAIVIPAFDFKIVFTLIIAGILFGVAALLFSKLTHFIERTSSRFIKTPYLIPFIFGFIIVGLYFLEGSYLYAGLGIETIQKALEEIVPFKLSVLKTFFTALTVGSGFKGGEFIPLVFIGTTLGSALAFLFPAALSLLAATGFAAVFAGAANTPLACAVMAAEIFGWKIFPYALLTCYLSYYFSGYHGIYHAQKVHRPKHHFLKRTFK